MSAGPVLFEPRVVVACAHQLDEAASALAWSADGQTLAAASLDGEVILVGRGEQEPLTGMDAHTPIVDLAWSPAGNVLAVAAEDGSVWLWPSGRCPVRLEAGETTDGLAWSPDGRLAVAAGERVVVVGATGERVAELVTGPGAATVVTWIGPDADSALLVGGVGGLSEHRVPFDAEPVETWPMATVVALGVHPASGIVAAGTLGGGLELISSRDCRGGRMGVARDAVVRVAWSAVDDLLAVVADGRLRTWKLLPERRGVTGPRHLQGHADWVADGAFSPTGPLLASVGLDGCLLLWAPGETHDALECCQLAGELSCLAWNSDGLTLAAGGSNGDVHILDCARLACPPS